MKGKYHKMTVSRSTFYMRLRFFFFLVKTSWNLINLYHQEMRSAAADFAAPACNSILKKYPKQGFHLNYWEQFGLVTAKTLPSQPDRVAGFPLSTEVFQIIILNRDYNVSSCVNLMVNSILNMPSGAVLHIKNPNPRCLPQVSLLKYYHLSC